MSPCVESESKLIVQDKRYRIKLPIVFGAIGLALLGGDLYAERVLESGPVQPDFLVWLDFASFWLMAGLFFPIQVIGGLTLWAIGIPPSHVSDMSLLPFGAVLWWWIGNRLDFGVLPTHRWRWSSAWAAVLGLVGLILAAWGVLGAAIQIKRGGHCSGHGFGDDHLVVILVSDILSWAWIFGLAVWSFAAGIRLIKLRKN